MKVGLFFGSFNPIHVGHELIANYMANFTDLDEVWLVVSPLNPLKDENHLLNFYDRLEMAKLATEQHDNIRVSDIEIHLPKPSYTIDTLTHLSERYTDREFVLIMGEDNLRTLHKWKNYERILELYQIYVYPRFDGTRDSEIYTHKSVTMTETPRVEISASFVRKAIAENKSVAGFLSSEVLNFIQNKSLYQ